MVPNRCSIAAKLLRRDLGHFFVTCKWYISHSPKFDSCPSLSLQIFQWSGWHNRYWSVGTTQWKPRCLVKHGLLPPEKKGWKMEETHGHESQVFLHQEVFKGKTPCTCSTQLEPLIKKKITENQLIGELEGAWTIYLNQLSHQKKSSDTFRSTGCSIGILTTVY